MIGQADGLREPTRPQEGVEGKILRGVSANWLGKLLGIVFSLVLTPILFHRLSQDELGLWYLVVQVSGLLALFDFGISPTLIRRIAMARADASSGDPLIAGKGRAEIAGLISTGRTTFRWLALATVLIGGLLGSAAISSIDSQGTGTGTILASWLVVCATNAFSIRTNIFSCLVSGIGMAGWSGLTSVVSTLVVFAAQITALWSGGGLLHLSLITLLGPAINGALAYTLLRRHAPDLLTAGATPSSALFRSIFRPALRLWVTILGAFLILKTDQYFIALYLGPASIPDYQAAYQVISNVFAIAVSFAGASSVFISQLWAAGDRPAIHRLVFGSLRAGLMCMACGSAFLLTSGREFFDAWLGPGHFVGYQLLIIFCIMLFLEAQHVIVATASRATEDEAFALWALGAGLLNLALTWALIGPFGLLGVALGTMIAQLTTNNWYAVVRGFRRLGIPLMKHLRLVIAPVLAIFILGISAGMLMKTQGPSGPWWQLGLPLVFDGAVLAIILGMPLLRRVRAVAR